MSADQRYWLAELTAHVLNGTMSSFWESVTETIVNLLESTQVGVATYPTHLK